MAFQQPQQRPITVRPAAQINETVQPQHIPVRKRSIEDPQEWILFSPVQNDDRSATSQTPRTATNWSDFGSLETRILSLAQAEVTSTCQATDYDDDSADLDSLDDGLHAFHQPLSTTTLSNHLDLNGSTVLPTHDGLGTFPSSSVGLQEHLWQFERHNPRRKSTRRRSSVHQKLETMEEHGGPDVEDERTARIEKWRLDQSKAVLEEIERETRRRRRKLQRMSVSGSITESRSQFIDSTSARAIPLIRSSVAREARAFRSDQQPSESFWQRITRRVLQDIIGIDDEMLSVIFGEQLPEDYSPTPTPSSPIADAVATRVVPEGLDMMQYGWETRLLERVARELGILVHHLAEQDSAFSLYRQRRQLTEGGTLSIKPHSPHSSFVRDERRSVLTNDESNNADPLFDPTLNSAMPNAGAEKEEKALWGIEEESGELAKPQDILRSEQDYWEREVDLKMIFQYLKNRLSSNSTVSTSPPPPTTTTTTTTADGPLPPQWSTKSIYTLGTSPDSVRRAEVIRQQHPLVSRATDRAAAQSRRRESLLMRRHPIPNHIHRRTHSGSCASQSTRRSRCSRSVGSRHYWDIGGSIGSGSGPAMSSALGAWGEV